MKMPVKRSGPHFQREVLSTRSLSSPSLRKGKPSTGGQRSWRWCRSIPRFSLELDELMLWCGLVLCFVFISGRNKRPPKKKRKRKRKRTTKLQSSAAFLARKWLKQKGKTKNKKLKARKKKKEQVTQDPKEGKKRKKVGWSI